MENINITKFANSWSWEGDATAEVITWPTPFPFQSSASKKTSQKGKLLELTALNVEYIYYKYGNLIRLKLVDMLTSW